MAYEQSLENIEVLKNLILPTENHQVFFDFFNDNEFKMIFFNRFELENIIGDLMTTKFRSKLPLARIIFNELDHEILYYEDTFLRYKYDLTARKILTHDSKETFRNHSPAELAAEMKKLLFRLKNM